MKSSSTVSADAAFCPKCNGTFHITKLKDAKVCPDCGAELIQRADDNPATIASRLQVYHEQTSPLTEYYADKGILKQRGRLSSDGRGYR